MYNECDCSKCANQPIVNDNLAIKVEKIWKDAFTDASLLPVIGFPSYNHGVLTLTHTDGSGMLTKINGLTSKSLMTNNALYSAECSNEKYINLYEIMIADIPGKNGNLSTAQIYINELYNQNLSVSEYHWTGASMWDCKENAEHSIAAIRHFSMDHPIEFSKKTIKALTALKIVDEIH